MPVVHAIPALAVGASFTLFGLAKVYGLARDIRCGRKGTMGQYVCSACPTWPRWAHFAAPAVMLAIGLANFGWAIAILLRKS
jgi:hypothetical protein